MAGPVRDFVGYGPEPPDFDWPGGARIAVNLVVNYEEGGEYSLGEDGVNDTWGEYSFQYGPEIRDIGTETHMEYGSRVGIWRLRRLIDRRQIPVTFAACALAVERNPPFGAWLRARDHDVLAHGYHWYGPDAVGLSRDQERDEISRAAESLERTTGRPLAGLDGQVLPHRSHPGTAGRARRFPLRLGRQQRRASLLRGHAGHAVPGGSVQQGAQRRQVPDRPDLRHAPSFLREPPAQPRLPARRGRGTAAARG